MTSFSDLGLDPTLLRALTAEGYTDPTPIQIQAIPPALAGADVLGIAQTGTGKTAAFALPILQRLAANRQPLARGMCRALILSPTRELASQIADSFRAYGRNTGLRVALMFGGVPKQRQVRAVERGVDVLVATPGRLIDHMQDRAVRFDAVEVLVLDEADHMLDLGFIVPIRRIVAALPSRRQTMFFSATMPKEIGALAGAMLKNPAQVAVAPVATTVERVEQHVLFVDAPRKRYALADLLHGQANGQTLVFTRTKHGADRVVKQLAEAGLDAAAIHGNKSQPQRERALAAFRNGAVRVLVATDIAARGIDVEGVSHVINFDLPNVPESYVHRIGRTARAGRAGVAISLCDGSERPFLRDIEKLIRAKVPVMADPSAAGHRRAA
ncbi:MAG TPA: DEAD/DEAH box helicase [Acetobacteraceae bacterium]|jgi:ATP-dependent RNA helicase RhlE|nr:DEAD/DEAH box helicase [Acetobacteraceae bacterium]